MANRTSNRGHRKKIDIDFKELERLCYMQCSEQEIAQWFHCSIDTIVLRIREKFSISFPEYFARHRVGGLISLRRNMFKLSEKSPAMAIFLAKNWLGMKDVQDIEGTFNQNIQQEIGVKVVNFNTKEVSDAIIEAIRLGLNSTILGGNGHGEDATLLPSQANIQTAPVPESQN